MKYGISISILNASGAPRGPKPLLSYCTSLPLTPAATGKALSHLGAAEQKKKNLGYSLTILGFF